MKKRWFDKMKKQWWKMKKKWRKNDLMKWSDIEGFPNFTKWKDEEKQSNNINGYQRIFQIDRMKEWRNDDLMKWSDSKGFIGNVSVIAKPAVVEVLNGIGSRQPQFYERLPTAGRKSACPCSKQVSLISKINSKKSILWWHISDLEYKFSSGGNL